MEQNPHGFPNVPEGAYVCNKSRPMPADRDQLGHQWYHVDAQAGEDDEEDFWFCPHCKHQWPLTTATARKVSVDESDPNPLPKPFKLLKITTGLPRAFAVKAYFNSRAEVENFEALVMRRKPWPAPKGLRMVQLGNDGMLSMKFVDDHAAIDFARSAGHDVKPAVWPIRMKNPTGAHDIRIESEPGTARLIAIFTHTGPAQEIASLLHGRPTDLQIERATLELLDKSKLISASGNWLATRSLTFDQWKDRMAKALVAVWTR